MNHIRKRNAISRVAVAGIIIVLAVAALGIYEIYGVPGGSGKTATITTTTTSITTSTATTTTSSTTVVPANLIGAGGTLINPVMQLWTYSYGQAYPGININYASVGSGAGIAQITAGTVDFGGSDAPLSAAQYAALTATLVTIPESASAVVPAYNIPGIGNGLNFTGSILAQIFLGTITQWNDPTIQAINPGVTLPNHAIVVVHRSDGSGTMFAFTDYLSQVSPQWKSQVGKGSSVNWPVGLGGKGNEGVAGVIQGNNYTIGPLEIAYEIINTGLISYGAVQNAAGTYVLANLTNIGDALAAGGSVALPAGDQQWTNVSIIDAIATNSTATTAYPITTLTYLMAYQHQTDQAKGTALVNFLWWVVHTGQGAGAKYGYASLPANIVALDEATIRSITYNGQQLYKGG